MLLGCEPVTVGTPDADPNAETPGMPAGATGTPVEPMATRVSLAQGYCEAMLTGVGVVDVEPDYLPNVVACENGGASFEALKAQAVAARSYLYHKLDSGGSIQDGTRDQVYSCGRTPSMNHVLAVATTAGQILQFRDTQVVGFYSAGARQMGPTCRGGASDPTNTERFITYNEGLTGSAVQQTTLGRVGPGVLLNRGAMSQNGAACLANQGMTYVQILKFYYGADVDIVDTQSSCAN
jgi:peptidoglycan hydrolase-like amidase